MTVQVVEVIRRTHQGVTQPYICRCDNGELYFVKGKGAGYSSLAKELIAGRLAAQFRLRIPAVAVLDVPKEFFGAGQDEWLADLGSGPVFGSKELDCANEISMTEVASLSPETKRDIAAFDWWILNADRTLSENGGNPNILWVPPADGPYVIDHNLGFDPGVTLSSLERDHIFGTALGEIVDTDGLQDTYEERFQAALEDWNRICEIPDRWNFVDDKCTVETGFTTDWALSLLRRYERGGMWTRP